MPRQADRFVRTPAPSILLVDNDPAIREAVTWVLEDVGYQVTPATTLAEALQRLHVQVFHLVLTDLLGKQPEDSLTSVRYLQRQGMPIPLGIITAWPIQDSHDAGFAFVLTKPFDIDTLLAHVSTTLAIPLTAQQEQDATVITAYFEALNDHNWERLSALCHDQVIYTLPQAPTQSHLIQGKAAFRSYTEAVFQHFPEAHFAHIIVTSLPNGLAARYQGSWRGADGASETLTGGIIFQVKDGYIEQIGVHLPDSMMLPAIFTVSEQAASP